MLKLCVYCNKIGVQEPDELGFSTCIFCGDSQEAVIRRGGGEKELEKYVTRATKK